MYTIDGSLSDWTSANLLNAPGTTTAGYSLYGDLSGGTLTFAIQAPVGTSIGTYTTIWLNTDRNASTGYNIWGLYGGYDYNINIAADGKPYLYTGADGQTLVSPTPLTFAYNADHTVLEVSVSAAQVGAPKSLNVLTDVNNTIFLPGDYSAGPYTITDPSSLPARTYTGHKVGIVYSDSTAANYFSTMAYSQLFMAAQNQATAAGVPYDLLSESDLTNLAKLSNYDELIFPSFRNVSAANVGAITDTLTTLEKTYHVGIITAGDFMTNDEKNAPLPGDSYARMKALLDVSPGGGVNGVNVDVTAAATTNPIMAGYTAGSSIHQYTNISTQFFTSTDGLGTTLANQTVSGQSHVAVMATQTGGKNVHFATDGMLADNNMLGHALDWTMAPATGPDVSLHMSRDKAIVAARVDMDQAMYTDDVHPASGQGIYDKLLPILAQWKQAYNFVASYYIDIGNNPAAGETTDWTYSKPYYNQILAMGNEIGSHSISHPEDTNVLTPAQFQSEFQQSRTIIEQQLGLTNIGAAIPGASDTLATARQIEQYYPYISGGASLIGAGYPGAIGYLSPAAADMKSVYIAPDTSFDFTLVGYQHLTAAQAEAAWTTEWNNLTAHSDLPVVVWPWHDYGPTDWLTDTTDAGYTQQMFTDFIARAAQAGSEFVTLADLAQRSATFEQSDVGYSYNAATNVLTASATTAAGDLGKFALDVGTGHTIKSVAGWYAYDSNSVFVPKAGGTFQIALDGTPDDVTHLTTLADRSDLLSVTGDGSNLSYSVVGEGHDIIQLKSHAGQMVQITGADAASLSGANLDLTLNGLGQHDVSVVLSAAPVGTAGNDTIIGTDNADVINGGPGADTLIGLGGNDTYIVDNIGDTVVEAANGGTDTVQSSITYTLPVNVENLVLTGTAAINGTGNALANVLTGNSAANTLSGGAGNDTLEGMWGNDVLTGGLGADIFIFNTPGHGVDRVTDFTPAQGDKLEVHASDYHLPIGALASSYFDSNVLGLATKLHAEFIFNSGSHTLSWDPDGLGGVAATPIATFSNNALLHYQDLIVIA
ncbi:MULTISPECIES: polysaccharide deacetylase family protein [unclassified Methylobacterium]|jgi:Ca2+-binding RTX toxin-like protein|uniref:polysaccharide deacetylase family protein n=2 Tax=Bacteria TaxID=2 RepID=UPI0037034334